MNKTIRFGYPHHLITDFVIWCKSDIVCMFMMMSDTTHCTGLLVYWNVSYKSYIFIWCPIFLGAVSYKNLPMQWDDWIMHGTSVYQCFTEICNISNLEICLVLWLSFIIVAYNAWSLLYFCLIFTDQTCCYWIFKLFCRSYHSFSFIQCLLLQCIDNGWLGDRKGIQPNMECRNMEWYPEK